MSAVISDHEAAGAVADPRTSGYMLAVKVSSHPALGNSGTSPTSPCISHISWREPTSPAMWGNISLP